MKIKYILIFLYLISIYSCEGQFNRDKKEIISNNSIVNNEIILDKLLKCEELDIRNNHYRIPDNGCVYSPNNGNKLGNADVILFPLIKNYDTNIIEKKCEGDINCLKEIYAKINSLNISEIKKTFNAIIFLIKKDYLKRTPKLDQSYTPNIPYKIISYILVDGKWKKGNFYTVKDDQSLMEENKWKDNYIDSLIRDFNYKKLINENKKTLSISQKWIGDYSTYFKYKGVVESQGWELNIKVSKDSIIAFGDGYQIGFKDELTPEDLGDKLILHHKTNLYGYTLGSKLKPEFVITKDGDNYFVLSEWISDIEEIPKKIGYKLNKTD